MGDTGIEPVTSSVSRKRSPTELIARGGSGNRTRVQGFAGPCLSHSAIPPEHPGTHRLPGPGGPAWTRGSPSGRRDSNPRPSPWQGDALPAALRPREQRVRCRVALWRTLAQAPGCFHHHPLPCRPRWSRTVSHGHGRPRAARTARGRSRARSTRATGYGLTGPVEELAQSTVVPGRPERDLDGVGVAAVVDRLDLDGHGRRARGNQLEHRR